MLLGRLFLFLMSPSLDSQSLKQPFSQRGLTCNNQSVPISWGQGSLEIPWGPFTQHIKSREYQGLFNRLFIPSSKSVPVLHAIFDRQTNGGGGGPTLC
jgi:hypothetical protein